MPSLHRYETELHALAACFADRRHVAQLRRLAGNDPFEWREHALVWHELWAGASDPPEALIELVLLDQTELNIRLALHQLRAQILDLLDRPPLLHRWDYWIRRLAALNAFDAIIRTQEARQVRDQLIAKAMRLQVPDATLEEINSAPARFATIEELEKALIPRRIAGRDV